MTPLALLEPVKVGGVTIERSTLHNQDEIDRKDVRAGDWVVVQRAGDVIPKVVSVIRERRTGKEKLFRIPSFCPLCESKGYKGRGHTQMYGWVVMQLLRSKNLSVILFLKEE